jgi:glucose-6-phosphate 1-dehydrogenase
LEDANLAVLVKKNQCFCIDHYSLTEIISNACASS